MKIFKFLSVLSVILIASTCSRDPLDKTIFVPDADDDNLPAYTEWGYNSFGAEYEREYFLFDYGIVPCKIVYKNGKLNFSLIGHLTGEDFDFNGNKAHLTLTFSFPMPAMRSDTDLLTLNNDSIDLTGAGCRLIFQNDQVTDTIAPRHGVLTFKRVQNLYVDGRPNRIILSGTFNVSYLRNDLPESFTNGRFDLGITPDYFVGEP
jgi:hypothetical protein